MSAKEPEHELTIPQTRSQHRHRLRQRARHAPPLPLLPRQTSIANTIKHRGRQQGEHVARQHPTRGEVTGLEGRVERDQYR